LGPRKSLLQFHRPHAALQVPVYLKPEVPAFLAAKAEKTGVEIDRIVNDLLKRDLGIIDAGRQ